MRILALGFLCAVVPLAAIGAEGGTNKTPERQAAFVPIPAFPAAGKRWQVGWWEGGSFHPARMLLDAEGNGLALLDVENQTLGDFVAVLRLSGDGDALRVSYADADGGAWSAQARDTATFRMPCPIFARDEPLQVVIRPIRDPDSDDGGE